ncbi:hypothetical protein PV10_07893 [Exophiala mesophila]|uniref:1-acyl-sn-glycerol-3-phosphate acyltransferase n=1 Tax=Exophiala mesophila TaxID=212818 RepID=A0A0D1Z718_EXOME|nr:uncharacterized protein PV10_07893 [Exophiala mesophila]KIV90607.1 hypothetical protein PV10_07893 [Exophiala mesophila]
MFFLLRYFLYFLVVYLLTTMITFLPNPPRILVFVARSLTAYFNLVICAIYGVIASAILKSLGIHFKYAFWTTARAFKWINIFSTGVRFDILDNGRQILDSNRPAVFVLNHQTELDVLFLAWMWPKHCSITAKKSLKSMPFLGWFMVVAGAIFIDRVDRSQAMKAFDGAATAIRSNRQSVVIFPEGTRSYSNEPMLLPFKKGAFHLAVQAGVPIVPVVAENYSRVLNIKARKFYSGTIRVKVLDPIPTKGLTASDVDALTRDTREKMLQAITELAQDPDSKAVDAKKRS